MKRSPSACRTSSPDTRGSLAHAPLARRALLALALIGALGCAAERGALPRPIVPPGEDPLAWSADLEAFARADRESRFAPGGVVFVGSSSIRLWSSLAEDMAPIPVLNRGFGGSRLFDAVYWSHELVSAHAPALAVVFSGTNDLAGANPKRPERLRELFLALVERLHREDDRLEIVYIAITPTLAREEHIALVRESNRLIRAECERDPRLEFVDPSPALMDASGRPDPQFFVDDRLHLNAKGYAVWTRALRPVLARRLGVALAPPHARSTTGR